MISPYLDRLDPEGLVIFLFHGVTDGPPRPIRNYTNKHLQRPAFQQLMSALAKAGRAVSMDEVVSAFLSHEPLPPHAFAITFDDGFRNNLTVAAPILADLDIPATFYITSGFVQDNGGSWIDLIEDAIERTHVVQLDLPLLKLHGQFVSLDQKIQLLEVIRHRIKTDPSLDPYEQTEAIRAQLQMGQFDPDPDLDAKLSWPEVAQLDRHPLFTVGGHTHTHRIMEFLSTAELRREIETSLHLLQGAVGRSIEHYSYPEGLAHCYSDRVIGELMRAGIRCAPTAEPGVNRVGDDLFRLKRVAVTFEGGDDRAGQ